MKRISFFILLIFLTSCFSSSLTWQEEKQQIRTDIENLFKADLNYDLALCESFVKSDKYKFLKSNELSSILYRADMQKDEYETSEQFQERQREEKSKYAKKIKQKTKSDYILYSDNSLMTYYDADSAKLFVKSDWVYKGLIDIEMIDSLSHFGSEKMQNAFGATVDVSRGAYHQFYICLAPFSNKILNEYDRREKLYYFSYKEKIYWPQVAPKEISVEPSNAKKLKENLRLLIVADPQNSYYTFGEAKYLEATFSSPISGISSKSKAVLKPITACYYDKKTKEVYSLFNSHYSNIGEGSDFEKFRYNESHLKERGL